jgi:hypothetical protein
MTNSDTELLTATARMKKCELAEAVTLLICIRVVLGSNLCRDTACHD